MPINNRGEKPRPRAVLLGEWPSSSAEEVQRLFPTSYHFQSCAELKKARIPKEVDVLICMGRKIDLAAGWYDRDIHTIIFGGTFGTVVRYNGPLCLTAGRDTCDSEQHDVLPVPPIFEAPLREWLGSFQSSRGMPVIFDGWPTAGDFRRRGGTLEDIAIVMSQEPRLPLAVHHFEEETKKGVAWFPSMPPNHMGWIRALLFHWAQSDPERLPGLRDWETTAEWMTSREQELSAKLTDLEQCRSRLLGELESEEARLKQVLLAARAEGNAGPRRILTTQDDELVSAVANVFRELGFGVREMDKELRPGGSNREDLRLTLGTKPGWEAIVEVKGYAKSGGKLNDISQIEKHAGYYAVEKGRLPDKKLYVVNGEFETTASPSMRRLPFSDEDLAPFANDGGLVLMTAELFHLHRDRGVIGVETAQRLLAEGNGRLPPEHRIGPSGS
jgi:hypothetical protein